MSDFQKYKKKRMKQDPEFWSGYDGRLETFKLGILLKQARLEQDFPWNKSQNVSKPQNPSCHVWKTMRPISVYLPSKNLP